MKTLVKKQTQFNIWNELSLNVISVHASTKKYGPMDSYKIDVCHDKIFCDSTISFYET